jgi:formate C-acetyltransferase
MNTTRLSKMGYKPSERLQRLITRINKYYKEGKRAQYDDNAKRMATMWRPSTEEYARKLGYPYKKYDIAHGDIKVGDFLCRVAADYPFPGGKFPSQKKGFSWDPVNWAGDYAHLLAHSPAEIHPDEKIVGEFHWMLEEFRNFEWAAEIDPLGARSVELGAGGRVRSHTCADLNFGLTVGQKGILAAIQRSRKRFEQSRGKEMEFLQAAEIVCQAMIEFIKKHAQKARSLVEKQSDREAKEHYLEIANVCEKIAEQPPSTFREAVQWIWFYIMADRMMTHANGYGRLDQLLKRFYFNDIKEDRLTKEEARELIAELWLKYSGTYFSLGGRDAALRDATNELSWVCLEAYDMVGGENTFGILWHEDIDKNFFAYACDVLARHGAGAPALLNYDVMRESLLHYGYKEEDAWNVAYTGCHWYCAVGKEYSSHDCCQILIAKCFIRAFRKACERNVNNFNGLFDLYCKEVEEAAQALKMLIDAQCRVQPLIWPEIVTSIMIPECIEKGKDVTDCGVPYNSISVDITGFANVVDSLYAIKKLVFEEKKVSLQELKKAIEINWERDEELRQTILNLPKYGEDVDEVDEIAMLIIDHLKRVLWGMKNCKGFGFRPSIFSWMNHVHAGEEVGSTPDGRKRKEQLAQSPDPMHGRNRRGITATARSLAKLGFKELMGGPWHLELDPSIFKGKYENNSGELIEEIAVPYFRMGGVHILVNVVSSETLEKAMEHPEEYGHIIVRVTGQPAHFIYLDRKIQEEITARTSHKKLGAIL